MTDTINQYVPLIQQDIKLFLLLLVVSTGAMYLLYYTMNGKFMMPGDYYTIKGSKRIYIPFGGVLIFTILAFVILKSKILFWILAIAALYIVYRWAIKRNW
ncbi:MAG: hypothetical protein PVJ52_02765 [Candidatus Woesebacteria bacterium]|jgi:hypothetical protein